MGEPVTLRDEDVGRIGEYVKPWIRSWWTGWFPRREPPGLDAAPMGGTVRVEEGLRGQRALMADRIAFIEQRFEAVDKQFKNLIAYHDKRIEDLIAHTDKRIETVDKRFNTVTWLIGVGFVVVTSLTTLLA